MIVVGCMFFVIPGLVLMARFSYGEFYCLLENSNWQDAISNSWEQTKSKQWLLISGILVIYLGAGLPILGMEYLLAQLGLSSIILTFVFEIVWALLPSLVTIFIFRIYMLSKHDNNEIV